MKEKRKGNSGFFKPELKKSRVETDKRSVIGAEGESFVRTRSARKATAALKKIEKADEKKELIYQSYQDYCSELLVDARRIKETAPGEQKYSGAQFEMALIGFGDLETLKAVIEDSVKTQNAPMVDLPASMICEYNSGFDWLDLSVSYHDEEAIAYFQKNLEDKHFYDAYQLYKTEYRTDTCLRAYENYAPAIQI